MNRTTSGIGQKAETDHRDGYRKDQDFQILATAFIASSSGHLLSVQTSDQA